MVVIEILKISHIIDGVAFHLQRKVKWCLLRNDLDNAIVGLEEDAQVLQELIVEIKIEKERRK